MTDEQEVSMVNSLEKIANALQGNPVRKFLEQKEYEDRLMKTYGPDLVNAWKKEYLLQDQAKQYVEHEAKVYKEKYEATRKLFTELFRYIPSNSDGIPGYEVETLLKNYKETIDRISSQFDSKPST
jgi:hypothetical protein